VPHLWRGPRYPRQQETEAIHGLRPLRGSDVCPGDDGITKLRQLVTRAEAGNAFERLADMERRYKKTCPKCGKTFWVTPELMKTSWFDGELTGYKCAAKGCDGTIGLEDAE